VEVAPIACIRTPYSQKFAIPRQPNLVKEAIGDIHFMPGFADVNALRGLEGFSHVWLIFVFHETAGKGWSATVTPPRLGGLERVGVFASRSPYRPNPLGLSVVEKVAVIQRGAELILRVRGIDLLDGTPILDIKPYLPYADSVAEATGGYAACRPGSAGLGEGNDSILERVVTFSSKALENIDKIVEVSSKQDSVSGNCETRLQILIQQVLQQDPRPVQHARNSDRREYGMLLYHYNIRWRETGHGAEVLSVDAIDPGAERHPWT
jgi:tRNA-Thr(GGU) m(6)t(6)A37 methyltransferase TsaA